MATRTIVTSQPDVACDVCERRLLRGEQPDVFIAAGRRRIVCELCAPRAAHEGWLRESDTASLSMPPMRPRRGRGFFERLLHAGRPASDQGAEEVIGAGGGKASYDFLDGSPSEGAASAPAIPARPPVHPSGEQFDDWGPQGVAHEDGEAAPPAAPSYLAQAIDVFNASEFPRRIAGVARSLGEPEVSARSAEHLASVVLIVVAWELCWYRYEVDISEGLADVRVQEQGTELSELAREDRVVNVLAGEGGALSLLAV